MDTGSGRGGEDEDGISPDEMADQGRAADDPDDPDGKDQEQQDVSLLREIITGRKSHVEILEREISNLDEQIAGIGQTSSAGDPTKKRARLTSLKLERRTYMLQKSVIILSSLHKKILDCVSKFCTDVNISRLYSRADIRRQLHAQYEYAENWQKFGEIPDYGDAGLKAKLKDTKSDLLRLELKSITALEREYDTREKKVKMPQTPGPPPQDEDEDQLEAEVEMRQLQRCIDKLTQQLACAQPTEISSPDSHDATTALKAAQYLKKQMHIMSHKLDQKCDLVGPSTGENLGGVRGDGQYFLGSLTSLMGKQPTGKGWLEFDETDQQGRSEFVGELKKDLEHGLGTMSWVDGVQYRGEFCNGLTDGYGIELYKDSSTYKGEFCKSHRHGIGAYVSATGEQYNGEWVFGEKQGYGIVSKRSQLKAVLAVFQGGDPVEILQEDAIQQDLSNRIEQVVRQAMATVSLLVELFCRMQ
jgi:hypothetical protein